MSDNPTGLTEYRLRGTRYEGFIIGTGWYGQGIGTHVTVSATNLAEYTKRFGFDTLDKAAVAYFHDTSCHGDFQTIDDGEVYRVDTDTVEYVRPTDHLIIRTVRSIDKRLIHEPKDRETFEGLEFE